MKWVKTLWTCSIVHFHHIIPINRYPPIITNAYINNSYILATLPIFHLPAVRTWPGPCFYIRWLLCAHIEQIRNFDLSMASGYTSKESSNPLFFGNYLFYTCATCSELPSYISTIVQDLHEGEELFVHYGMDMEEAPQWYHDSWDLYSMGDQPGQSHVYIDQQFQGYTQRVTQIELRALSILLHIYPQYYVRTVSSFSLK